MALSASSSCTKTVMAVSEPAKVLKSSFGKASPAGALLTLPVKPKFQSSALRRTKSRKPVEGAKVSASLQEAASPTSQTAESVISQAVSKVGDEIASTSGEILDTVDAVIEEGPAAMRVRRSSGKTNTRTSRRRALVMCLALGMVRPCASNVESNMQSSTDLRRTASAMPALRRTTSTSFKAPSTLASQVSLATTMKQTNLLGEQEDLQKLTSLQ